MKIIDKIGYIIILLFSLFLVGCNPNNDIEKHPETIAVKVKLNGINTPIVDVFDKNSSLTGVSPASPPIVQSLGEGLDIIAELVPDAADKKGKFKTQKLSTIEPLGNNIRYKLVVYSTSGAYIDEIDYVHTQEHLAESLWLVDGTSYTFVAYSINSASTLPAITFRDGIQDISHSEILGIDYSTDFLYFKIENKLISNTGGNNTVPITFRHNHAEVQIIIDAEAEGTVKTANGNIGNLIQQTITNPIQLLDGLGNDTSPTTVAMNFPSLNTAVVSSNTVRVIPRQSVTTLTFSELTIHSTVNPIARDITRTNETLTGFDFQPGHRYRIRITINPDWYFTTIPGIATERIQAQNYRNYPAVRIQGRYWMLHNIGTNSYTVNPFITPNAPSIRGLYYQWGVNTGLSKDNVTISPWTVPADNSATRWNSGTEAAPVKTSNDPCPSGWRVPTAREYVDLTGATNHENSTPWPNVHEYANTSAAKILVSKKSSIVRIPFPIAGRRTVETGVLSQIAQFGFYWTSLRRLDVVEIDRSNNLNFRDNLITLDGYSNIGNGFQIRCVADIRQNPDGSLVSFPF